MWKITIVLIAVCILTYFIRLAVEAGQEILPDFLKIVTVGLEIGLVILVVKHIANKNKDKNNQHRYKDKNATAETAWYHGTAGFASDEEIKDLTVDINSCLKAGSVYLGHLENNKGIVALPREKAAQHGLVIGATGTGKSRGYFLGNCAWVGETSIVVTDPKSELWKLTSGHHKLASRYAPTDPDNSNGFNWIPLCNKTRWAQLCARAIMESGGNDKADPFWTDVETAYLSALFAHTSTLDIPTPVTAYRLFTRQKPETLLEQLLNSKSSVAREEAIVFSQTDPKIKGGIVPAIAGKLQFLRDPEIARFTSAVLEPPDFSKLREIPQAIYFCLREQDISRLRPLTSLFFTILLEQIANIGEEGLTGTPVSLFLDEFANIGKLPDFATTISLARGRGVALWLGIQSFGQLESGYGKANAETIITNCQTKIILHGLDPKSAKYVSDMLGETTVVAEKKSYNDAGGLIARLSNGKIKLGGSTTYNTTEHRRNLLTADEVNRISDNEALIKTSNRKPFVLPKIFYNEAPKTAKANVLGEARALDFDITPRNVRDEDDFLDIEPPKRKK